MQRQSDSPMHHHWIPLSAADPAMFLRAEAVRRLTDNCCPIDGTPLPDEPGFLLVSRYRVTSSSTMFVGVGVAGYHEFEIQGCYVPVSDKIATRARSVEGLGGRAIRIFLFGLGLLGVTMVAGFTGLFERMGRIGEMTAGVIGWGILASLLVPGLLLGLKWICRRSFSRQLLNPGLKEWKIGLPDQLMEKFPLLRDSEGADD
jgi:hypothetical protein